MDKYHGILRLDLARFDGSPLQPLYILYRPPSMLPTTTLNPSKATGKSKRAVGVDGTENQISSIVRSIDPVIIERWWWFGVISTSVGGLVLWCS